MTLLGCTGHRIQFFDKWETPRDQLERMAITTLKVSTPSAVVSGMATGWDLAFASAAQTLGIPLIAAIPHYGQANKWDEVDRRMWAQLVAYAKGSGECRFLSEQYERGIMFRRNRWLAHRLHQERGSRMIALYDGRPRGGTKHCVEYCQKIDLPLTNLWANWKRYAIPAQRETMDSAVSSVVSAFEGKIIKE